MNNLDEYDAYYDEGGETLIFERVLRVYVDQSRDVPDLDQLLGWLPQDDANSYIRVYWDDTLKAFRQEVHGKWQKPMKRAIKTLAMRPDPDNKYRLINVNDEETSKVKFGTGENTWRIVDWVTRVTKSKDLPFNEIKAFPKKGNLLCDLIVWRRGIEGEGEIDVEMSYGWNAYLKKTV